MSDERTERAVIRQVDLLAMGKGDATRQSMGHVQRGHPEENEDEERRWDKDYRFVPS